MGGERFDILARTLAAGVDRRRVLGGLLAAALRASAPAGAPRATAAAEAGPSWLFVQAFDSAALAPDPAAAGGYILTLYGVDEASLAFAERPNRQVATVPTAAFVAAVSAERGDPMNATLVAPLADGAAALVVVELLAAAHQAAAGSVTYRVAVLAQEEGAVRAAATPLAGPVGGQAFGAGHLLVDDSCEPCGRACCPSHTFCAGVTDADGICDTLPHEVVEVVK